MAKARLLSRITGFPSDKPWAISASLGTEKAWKCTVKH